MRPTRARLCDAITTEGGARVRSCSTPADMASGHTFADPPDVADGF